MKITLKLNIGNYQSIDFTTNEYNPEEMVGVSAKESCYAELYDFLKDWEDITGNATKLKNHIEGILRR